LWSDGTAITADDLLLSHVISSNEYSIKAGLGDPDNTDALPAFDSGGYGATYSKNVVGMPVLSADHMSLTVQYKAKIANWDYYAPGAFPVHTLELMAAGKKAYGSAAENKAAKDKFYDDVTKMNTASLKAMAKIWSTAYDITTVNSSTNPLLLVGNGNFKIESAVDNQSVTLVLDEKLNGVSGPKTTGFTKMIFRFDVSDAAAPQALANKEIDLYQGQVTPDAAAALKTIKGVNLIGGTQATFEQISLRVKESAGQTDTYKGPFTNPQVRKAFLLAYPREEILAKLIKPVVPGAKVLDSRFVMPDQGTTYDTFIKGNGSAAFTAGTQASRTAAALRIMKSVYGADVLSSPIAINMDYKNSARRIDAFTIAKSGLAKAGFNLTGAPNARWSAELDLTKYDAAMFAWGAGLPTQNGDCGQIKSSVGNNHSGWNSAKIDKLCESLEGAAMSENTKNRTWQNTERELMAQYWTLGLYQWPALTVVNSDLSGVKPSAVVPNLVWNYWEWHF
jgi:peptide/nickel transport system substrate-binding protein